MRKNNKNISKQKMKKKQKTKSLEDIRIFNLLIKFSWAFSLLLIYLFLKENKNFNNQKGYKNNLIKENFFVIDSNNLKSIKSHMYGFSVSKTGILTDNYFKKKNYTEDLEPQGAYIMIRKNEEEIRISQDYFGSFGLYLYENKNKDYFALSNSFLLLEEFLVGKQNFSFNKVFADNFIITPFCSPSINETMINEITKLPSNAVIIINIEKKEIKFSYIDYKEGTIPIESEEGLKLIDKWVDKWGYIIRSLKKQTDNFAFDLTGGFDTRLVLSLLLNSGINIKNTYIRSVNRNNPSYNEDFKIASNISSKLGFNLDNNTFDNRSIKWSLNDTIFSSVYPKLGVHKVFNLQKEFYLKPRFIFSGSGGENIRGYPGYPLEQYIERISSQAKNITKHENEFYNSTLKLCYKNLDLLKYLRSYNNSFEISADFYAKSFSRSHFGSEIVENFLANVYLIQPLIDPDIKKIKFDIKDQYPHDLIAYIYFRFAKDLIYVQIEGNRFLNPLSVKKAEKLNKMNSRYEIKSELNENFYIDIERKCPVPPTFEYSNAENYLKDLFKSYKFFKDIKKYYINDIDEFVREYNLKSDSFS